MLRAVPIHFIFENNVGERRIRHETTLKRRHFCHIQYVTHTVCDILDSNFPFSRELFDIFLGTITNGKGTVIRNSIRSRNFERLG